MIFDFLTTVNKENARWKYEVREDETSFRKTEKSKIRGKMETWPVRTKSSINDQPYTLIASTKIDK